MSSEPFNLSNPNRTVHVGVILFGGLTELLDVAPMDLFHGLTPKFLQPLPDGFVAPHLKQQAIDMEFHWVTETGKVPSTNNVTVGATIVPTDSFVTCPALDIVLIGAHRFGYNLTETELTFLRKAYDECSAFLTICGGVQAPLSAGLLEGKTATGPRFFLDVLRQQAPGTNWVEKRWVSDGKLWTSGALLNGTDMVAAFQREVWGGKSLTAEDSLVEFMARLGSVPVRDIDYKDDDGKL
ncbi:class I glutamine amidotransferase-like protein [Triangularia verruculosa]|uniref:Class I glutamine amidotransferase-like protein n=1 Tax=Triangularia verruculosa TaxID=2587418 RepID=A0AAN6XDE6_9PEZI|nr:class I glutamine amidotransferase-like protein [Triangularia verruculosa]